MVYAVAGSVFALSVAGAVLSSRSVQWEHWQLVVVLAVAAVAGSFLTITVRDVTLSAELSTMALAIVLLGPAPAWPGTSLTGSTGQHRGRDEPAISPTFRFPHSFAAYSSARSSTLSALNPALEESAKRRSLHCFSSVHSSLVA